MEESTKKLLEECLEQQKTHVCPEGPEHHIKTCVPQGIVTNFLEIPDIMHHWVRFAIDREKVDAAYNSGMNPAAMALVIADVVTIQVYQMLVKYATVNHITFPKAEDQPKLD